MKRFTVFAAAAATLLILSGCSAPTASPDATDGTGATGATGEAVATETPSATPPPTVEASEYGPCPDGLVDAANAVANFEWTDVTWSEMNLPEGVDAPVASCVLMGASPDWTEAYYVGAGQELADQLNAALSDAGIPPHVDDFPSPGRTTWGSGDTGFAVVQMVALDDASISSVEHVFTEPFVEFSVHGNPGS